MAHLSHDTDALIARVRRIAGQVQAIERALASNAECGKVLHLVAATRGAMNGLVDEIVAAQAQEHVAAPGLSDAQRAEGLEDLLKAMRLYAK